MSVSIGMKRAVTLVAVLALVVGAFALAGCGGTKESPGGPSGTGVSEDAKVSAADRTAVLASLKAQGMKASADYVLMAYGEGKATVEVTGEVADKAGTALAKVVFKKGAKGAWVLDKVTGKAK